MAGTEAVSKATVRIYLNFRSVKVHSHSNILFRLIQDIGLKAIYICSGNLRRIANLEEAPNLEELGM